MRFIDKMSEAKSKSQRRLMGMVHAYQNGTLENFNDLPKELQSKIKSMAKSMSHKQTKEYAETKHNKNMPEKKAEIVFNKLAYDRFEETLDNQQDVLTSQIDRQNKRVKKKTVEYTGKATGIGAGVGALAGTAYPFLKRDGSRKLLRSALKGGGIGAAIAGVGSLGYILPKAYKAYVTRQEERDIKGLLDSQQDTLRENRIRAGAAKLKSFYENRQSS